jgi:hypothetical protein
MDAGQSSDDGGDIVGIGPGDLVVSDDEDDNEFPDLD